MAERDLQAGNIFRLFKTLSINATFDVNVYNVTNVTNTIYSKIDRNSFLSITRFTILKLLFKIQINHCTIVIYKIFGNRWFVLKRIALNKN